MYCNIFFQDQIWLNYKKTKITDKDYIRIFGSCNTHLSQNRKNDILNLLINLKKYVNKKLLHFFMDFAKKMEVKVSNILIFKLQIKKLSSIF